MQFSSHQYSADLEQPVLLNPLARAAPNAKGEYTFTDKTMPKVVPLAEGVAKAAGQIAAKSPNVFAVGTDVELISAVPYDNENFLKRNFTEAELEYCMKAADSRASLAGRWSAKEVSLTVGTCTELLWGG